MKSKLFKAVLSIAAVACLSVGVFQFTGKDNAQEAKAPISKFMVDPGPGGG
ncbi:hypothetical protein [Bacillus sp. AFS075034]|uniref:hypothetical protein n=1 Tax=Bacillus sp. AFS075034 TaxID=2034281 RepID=UPI00159B8D70|nr:hypothetical protein [Bacillus sp. AFS075034]